MNTIKKLLAVFFLSLFACGDHEVSGGGVPNEADPPILPGDSTHGDPVIPQIPCTTIDYSTQFCFNGIAYALCGNKKYYPPREFCFVEAGTIHLKCGDKEFNPREEFCFKNIIRNLCGGQSFDFDEEFCGINHQIYTNCGGIPYSNFVFTHFCYNNVLYSRCNNSNPLDEFCEDENVPEAVCGIEKYKTAEHFCIGDKIYLRCGGRKYNPSEEFCLEGEFYSRCGGKPYDPRDEFCFGAVIYSRCSGEQYNPTEQFCYSDIRISPPRDSLYSMCGGEEYDPSKQLCRRTKIINLCGNYELLDDEVCFDDVPYRKCPSSEQFCDKINGTVYKLCKGKKYNIAEFFCDKEREVPLCNGEIFDYDAQFCDTYDKKIEDRCLVEIEQNGRIINIEVPPTDDKICSKQTRRIIDRCGPITATNNWGKWNDITEICVNGVEIRQKNPIEKCGDIEINTDKQWCGLDNDDITPKAYPKCAGLPRKPTECCNNFMAGAGFDNTKNFCGTEFDDNDSKIYAKCGTENNGLYNPLDTGCYNGTKYARCSNANARGVCVNNTVLRCKQLKGTPSMPDSDYIIDPLPGFECNSLGVIAGPYTDVRNNEPYGQVQIGSQVWLRKNLNYIPSDPLETCSGNDGCLYTSSAANSPGLCPDGFFLPTQSDWDRLVEYAGGEYFAGDRLKTASDWGITTNDIGTNAYGFDAKPPTNSYYHGVVVEGVFWWEANSNYYRNIISADAEIRRHFVHPLNTDEAFVRCVRYSAVLPGR